MVDAPSAETRAGVGLSTVRDFEKGERTPIANNLAAIRRVIEAAGIKLVFRDDGEAAGIAANDPSETAQRPRGRG